MLLDFPSSNDAGEPYDDADPAKVDLARFRVTPLIHACYDWAFQTGTPETFRPDFWDDLASIMDGASPGTITTPSPMADPNSALRVTLGTAFARWKFEFETWLPLSVRELAYLAQMTEVGARNALAEAGIKGRGGIENDVARDWLTKRRKFVPTQPGLLPAAN